MERKGFNLRVIAGRVCVATTMLILLLSGQHHASAESSQFKVGPNTSVYEQGNEEVIPLDLNDPVPKI
ncbi:hypothetical protein [Paenibacillus illinoisensis]|uniref:hypothetical protein n=1 Tax=Paenibacillus illinoisensis TaxID=59845 RepID=UPI00301BCFC8